MLVPVLHTVTGAFSHCNIGSSMSRMSLEVISKLCAKSLTMCVSTLISHDHTFACLVQIAPSNIGKVNMQHLSALPGLCEADRYIVHKLA